MTKPLGQYTIYHTVMLDDISNQIEILMKKIFHVGGERLIRFLIPTLLYVHVPANLPEKHTTPVNKFLRGLRGAHHNHFVRFCTPLLWVAASNSGDIFYSRDYDQSGFCDVILGLRVISRGEVEVKIDIPYVSPKHRFLSTLSRTMVREISAPNKPDSEECYTDLLNDFHRRTKMAIRIRECEEPCHVFLFPNKDRTHFHPVPIWGLSIDDAKRRYRFSQNDFTFVSTLNPDYLPTHAPDQNVFFNIVNLIYDNLEADSRINSAKDTYGLMEMLLGYYVTNRHSRRQVISSHELVLLDFPMDNDVEELDHFVDIFPLPMRNVPID